MIHGVYPEWYCCHNKFKQKYKESVILSTISNAVLQVCRILKLNVISMNMEEDGNSEDHLKDEIKMKLKNDQTLSLPRSLSVMTRWRDSAFPLVMFIDLMIHCQQRQSMKYFRRLLIRPNHCTYNRTIGLQYLLIMMLGIISLTRQCSELM